ncbi:Hsp20/alpha crystallin family protein [Hymenobacter wooponensis]|uniref:Hsp20 family protein n=1 Tax=Hymenobacter wooponensis TaxID=1525360 RepID=A0A4Z0MDL3_9BACT|nr:Hsp20/alpha crystallin family protein [Hymenobacter wooponensis]TGD77852.1 Hsp20 family protein [Hymenobacter wooponensis]
MNLISKEFIHNIAPQLDLLNTLGGGIAQAMLHVDQREKGVVVRVALPSVSPDNFHVLLQNNTLTVYADYRHTPEDQLSAPLFSRTLKLPANLDANRVDAVFEGHELQVRIPFRDPAEQREITIKQR